MSSDRKSVSNVSAVILEREGEDPKVLGVFRPSEESKTPMRAAKAYLSALSESVEYGQDVSEGRVFILNGHPVVPKRVTAVTFE